MSEKRWGLANTLRHTSRRSLQSIAGAPARMSQRMSRRQTPQKKHSKALWHLEAPPQTDDEGDDLGEDSADANAASAEDFFATIDDVGARGKLDRIGRAIGSISDEEEVSDAGKNFPEEQDPDVLQLLNRLSVLSTNFRKRPDEDTIVDRPRRPHFQPEVDEKKTANEQNEANRAEGQSPPEPTTAPPAHAPRRPGPVFRESGAEVVQHAHIPIDSVNAGIEYGASVGVFSKLTQVGMDLKYVRNRKMRGQPDQAMLSSPLLAVDTSMGESLNVCGAIRDVGKREVKQFSSGLLRDSVRAKYARVAMRGFGDAGDVKKWHKKMCSHNPVFERGNISNVCP